MVELALVPADDHQEVVRAEDQVYARNALVQLRRVAGKDRRSKKTTCATAR